MDHKNNALPPRILVVEDEGLIGLLVTSQLEESGFRVVGPATSVSKALALIKEEGCEAAVLDVQLGDESAEPIAAELTARNTPYVTVSGYSREQRPPAFEGAAMLVKPVRMNELVAELRRCLKEREQR